GPGAAAGRSRGAAAGARRGERAGGGGDGGGHLPHLRLGLRDRGDRHRRARWRHARQAGRHRVHRGGRARRGRATHRGAALPLPGRAGGGEVAVLAGRARHAPPRSSRAGVIRAFVALLLDEALRASIAATIERLRPLGSAVAWVPPRNLHVTLHFLGEQSEERLVEAEAALADAAAGSAPLDVTFHGVGAFPGLERPRILWVGLAQGALDARAPAGAGDGRARLARICEGGAG